jgi:hypothetical protein
MSNLLHLRAYLDIDDYFDVLDELTYEEDLSYDARRLEPRFRHWLAQARESIVNREIHHKVLEFEPRFRRWLAHSRETIVKREANPDKVWEFIHQGYDYDEAQELVERVLMRQLSWY